MMEISVKGVNVSIDTDRKHTGFNDFKLVDVLSGDIKVHITAGKYANFINIRADQNVSIRSISKENQKLLIDAIRAIESELRGS